MTRALLFARVSTGKQNSDRQIHDLTAEAKCQGWQIVATVQEVMSGTRRTKERPELVSLLDKCRAREVDKLVVTEVSRLGRRTSEVLAVLEELHELKVSVFVLNYRLETLLPSGKPNPMAQLIFTLLAEFARLEKETLVERINSGLDAARRKGKQLGRPTGTSQDDAATLERYPKVVAKLRERLSIRDVAKVCSVSEGTVKKVKKLLPAK